MANKRREIQKKNKLNNQIRCSEVRLVGDNVDAGKVVTLEEAKELSMKLGLDLVLVNEKSEPYICKIMDYNKFLFDASKKPSQPKPKPIKEMRYTPNTDDHDFDFKLRHVKSFLSKGHKVKAFVFFKGRELDYKDKGEAMLLRLSVAVEGEGVPESMPKFEGRKCTIILKPNKK